MTARNDRRENWKFLVLLVLFALMLLALFAPRSRAQQPDPNQQLALEWQAVALQQHHAEDAINRLIASYEARLMTALDWLREAQAAAADKH